MELRDLRILVVEDQGFQRWLICDLLQQLGVASVAPADDGQAALDLLAQGGFDVVVSDLDMPGMDGLQLIRHLGERGDPIALVIVSAQEPGLLASVETMAQEYGVRVAAVLQKPLTARKLELALQAKGRVSSAAEPGAHDAFLFDELAEALRTGQFVAFFQPKVDMFSQRTVGAEALVRWLHRDRGPLAPGAFIAAVERCGLMGEMTRVVCEQALTACREWQAAGAGVGVSINLSAVSLADMAFPERAAALTRDAGLDPPQVTFEVTESAAGTEAASGLENLSRLRMKGFRLSIDDFGTGYSSMHRLSRLPFGEIKIDQSFVMRATRDGPSRAIVESSLELARKLNIEAVAEGVRSREEWEMLVALRCPIAQGYHIGRPMSAADFARWLGNSNEDCA